MKGVSFLSKLKATVSCEALVIGHSHCAALEGALKEQPDPSVRVINLRSEENAALTDGRAPGEALADAFAPRHLFSMIGGNSHYQVSLLEHEDKIQFLYGSEDQDLPPDRTLVTHALMRRLLHRAAEPHLEMMDKLKQIFGLPLAHILPPPPLGVDDITEFLPPGLKETNEHGVVPPPLRLRLYRLQCDILREHCRQSGITVIEPPEKALTPLGFLKRNLRGWNATHAGQEYGALVLAQIRETVNG